MHRDVLTVLYLRYFLGDLPDDLDPPLLSFPHVVTLGGQVGPSGLQARGDVTSDMNTQSIHVLMRDEKEGRKKEARSNKQQDKATQHTQGSHFS